MFNKKNILLVNPFGIGDVLFSTPLIHILNNKFPDAVINYVCNNRAYHVLKNNPFLKEKIIYEKDYFRKLLKKSKIKFFKEFFFLLKKIRDLKSDVLIDLSLNYETPLIGKILYIPERIGFNYKNRGKFLTKKVDIEGFEHKHVVSYYLDLLKLLDIDVKENVYPETFTEKKTDEWAEEIMRNYGIEKKNILGLIPGGGKSWGEEARYRRWPASNFSHVADKLIDNFGIVVILLGSKEEDKLCDNVQSFMRNKPINLGGKTSVEEFMSLIKRCNAVLCNEGGPLHIAVALGTPTVSIFGPVDEKVYGPFAKDMSKHIVVSDRIKCQPCYSKFKHKVCETRICLNSISENRVYEAVKTLVERMV